MPDSLETLVALAIGANVLADDSAVIRWTSAGALITNCC